MKRRTYVHPRWRWRMGGYLLVGTVIALFVLVKLQTLIVSDSPDIAEFPMTNFEIPQFSNTTKPKLAFLFLVRQQMPLDVLWEHFFEGSEEHEYSVYIHARPGYPYTRHNTVCSSFINRQLQNSVQVQWGEVTMIQAERLLLTEALQDPLNERFFLLSDSCIPLYNFRYVYDYVMSSQKSFVDSFYNYADAQYNILMDPIITENKWRKGSQWFTLTRKHAEIVAADSTVFSTFVYHCKKAVLLDTWNDDSVNNETDSHHNCIPDEHYIQTLLAMKDMEGELERRTLTYSQWQNINGKGRWHPVTFDSPDATLDTIKQIQAVMNVRYDTEGRTEWCSAGGESRPCFLFARKFTKTAGFRLLDEVEHYESGH